MLRMRLMLFVVATSMAVIACGNGSPTQPTPLGQTPPPLSTGGPSHTVLELVRTVVNQYDAYISGNVKLGMHHMPFFLLKPKPGMPANDSLSGGQLVIREYSCGSRNSARGAYAGSAPRQNSDTTVVRGVTFCGQPQFEMWVETYYVGLGHEEPIQHLFEFAKIVNPTLKADESAPWRVRGTLP